jgi:hypothetical protein
MFALYERATNGRKLWFAIPRSVFPSVVGLCAAVHVYVLFPNLCALSVANRTLVLVVNYCDDLNPIDAMRQRIAERANATSIGD